MARAKEKQPNKINPNKGEVHVMQPMVVAGKNDRLACTTADTTMVIGINPRLLRQMIQHGAQTVVLKVEPNKATKREVAQARREKTIKPIKEKHQEKSNEL